MLRYLYIILGWKHLKKVLMLLGAVWIYQNFWVSDPNWIVTKNPDATHLTAAESQYYQQIFDYVMAQPAKTYEKKWDTISGSGVIAAGERFKSLSGYQCRPFREHYTIGNIKKEATGYGCKRDGEAGWCKLKPEDPHNCALEPPQTIIGKFIKKEQDISHSADKIIRRAAEFW